MYVKIESNVWLGHNTITTIGSLALKGLTSLNKTFVGMSALLVIIHPLRLVSLYGNSISELKRLKCMNESGPVLLMP